MKADVSAAKPLRTDKSTPDTHRMKTDKLRPRPRMRSALVLVAITAALAAQCLLASNTAKPKHPLPPRSSKPEKKKLSGAELYAIHCNRCHPERYAAERTEAQWKTILLHMRTRANLPAEQARAIMRYLQEDSGA